MRHLALICILALAACADGPHSPLEIDRATCTAEGGTPNTVYDQVTKSQTVECWKGE